MPVFPAQKARTALTLDHSPAHCVLSALGRRELAAHRLLTARVSLISLAAHRLLTARVSLISLAAHRLLTARVSLISLAAHKLLTARVILISLAAHRLLTARVSQFTGSTQATHCKGKSFHWQHTGYSLQG